MQRTRRQILDILKKRGRAALDELARDVGLSPVTVRVHLSVLQRDDLVKVEEVRGRVGRPHFMYSLTEDAEDFFPKRYHALANRLLTSLADTLPQESVQAVLDHMAETWAVERAVRLAGKDLATRIAEVTQIRTEEGAMADWEQVDGSFWIRQHNCPSLLVSRLHPLVCEVEQQYLSKMLGAPLKRAGSIALGDRVCAYQIGQPAGN